MPRGQYKQLTSEDEQKIIDEYLEKPVKILASEIGISFGRVKRVLKRNGLVIPKEIVEQRKKAGRFKKGQTPRNKGLKQTDFMSPEAIERTKATRFKKGQNPHNTKFDGAIVSRKDKSGNTYQWIRISKGHWEMLHRHVWEKANGPVPEDHIVYFANGDTMNADLSNLKLITRTEHMLRNSVHDYPEEIIPSLVLVKQLERKLKSIEDA